MGGNAKTSLVVAIADAAEHLDETLQSIQFGQRAMRVQTKARVNESVGRDLLNVNLLKRLTEKDIAYCVVDANLLAKEVELRKIQEALAVSNLFLLNPSNSRSKIRSSVLMVSIDSILVIIYLHAAAHPAK